ncbi:MAG: VOC family protein [Bacteroidetes bacterium]|nr:MAG: VOC family protein [Bacteroidota bacterium]
MENEGKIIGLGGIFLKFKDPKKMNEWYREVLGLESNDYGVLFAYNALVAQRAFLQLGTFDLESSYFGEQKQLAMLNFRVQNLDDFLLRLKSYNVQVLDEVESYEYGRFVHISDPEGNRIELWEPVDQIFEKTEGFMDMY